MRCPQCQHENPFGATFCNSCGARLELVCPACKHTNVAGSRFCNSCGRAVGDATSALQPSRFTSPETYTPKHLAEKILTSKSALEGERKQVTVLFADMKGSMELLADRDPEEARKILDPVLVHMMEAVHRYEGTVNQVMGDGIMALFGAPLAHEDHAVRACYAALRMQESVKRYAEGVRRTEGIPIQIRVGLNSGEVVVRSIGSDLKMDYTAVGQTTHLAARMEQMATPGSVLMTPEALRLAEGFIQVKPLGPVTVKGLAEPLEVYEVSGVGAARSRLQAAAARGLTRFVGRDKEIGQLRTALERASTSHGQVVAVVGEPGLGKSRLFHEFTHSHRTQDWLIVESGSVSYGKATPYLPLIDLLKAYFKIHDRDNQREIREKITGKLLTLDESLKPTLPVFLALLDIPVDDPQWQVLDPPQKRQRTLDACKRLFFRESQAQPLLLVFEDLHWIDAETQTLLDSLVESLPTARLLLLVNYRPEYQHGWGSKTYYSQLRLDPLPTENAEELLHSLLGNDPSLHALKQLLIARTEGNPFFLEESVRTLVETKALDGERGAYRVAKSVENIQVPATVQAVLAARIDRLPAENKRLLQSAAVIGKDVPFVLLRTIADLSEDDLRRCLAHLQTGEFLYETSLFPELEYTFKHALTHEVAYGSLLQERRRALHGRIVEAIEKLYSDRLAEQAELLAHHAFRGELWEKAVTYLCQAGVKAAGRSADREAVGSFDQALEALSHLPQSREMIEQAIDLRFALRNALLPLGQLEQMSDYLREAETLVQPLNDQRRLGWLSAYLASDFVQKGDSDRGIESARRAIAVADDLKDFALQVVANLNLGNAYAARGDYRRAMDYLRWNVESLKGERVYERVGVPGLHSFISHTYLAWCLAELGEFAEANIRGEEAIRIAESADQPYSLSNASWGVGYVHLRNGNIEKAIITLERGLKLCQTWNIRRWLPRIASALGYAYALSERITDALPLLEQALGQGASMRRVRSNSYLVGQLGEGYLLAGRIEDAIVNAGRALDLARQQKQRGDKPMPSVFSARSLRTKIRLT